MYKEPEYAALVAKAHARRAVVVRETRYQCERICFDLHVCSPSLCID